MWASVAKSRENYEFLVKTAPKGRQIPQRFLQN